MRLITTVPPSQQHNEFTTGVTWNPAHELYSIADDKTIAKWSLSGEPAGQVATIDAFATSIHWTPIGKRQAQVDAFAVSFTDGSFAMYSKSGKEEWRTRDAHKGAVIKVAWNHEGNALATAGEDGVVKVWSRTGMLRSQLHNADHSVYSIAWGPDSDRLVLCAGRDLVVKPLQPGGKHATWKGHDHTVLSVDWSAASQVIVSGGEDNKYKVWDSFGRLLHSSQPLEQPVTCVKFSAGGELFAVGGFETLQLCDKDGRCHSKSSLNCGSVYSIDWTPDGTMLAAGCASGEVVFGQVVERVAQWGPLEARLIEPCRVRLKDGSSEAEESLDFRDRVVTMSLGFGHLIVVTTSQCLVHALHNMNTPVIFDIKNVVMFVKQSEKFFVIADAVNGVQAYNYEGRLVCTPKFVGLRAEMLEVNTVSVCPDCIASVDHADPRLVRVVDAASGKPLGEPIKHSVDVAHVALNQFGNMQQRKLVIVDRNSDLFLCGISSTASNKSRLVKLGTLCDTVAWNTDSDVLGAVSDGKLCFWYYPNVVFVDRDLIEETRTVQDATDLGKAPRISSFSGLQCTLARSDGASVHVGVSPFPGMLYELVQRGDWEKAIQMCRYVKDRMVWSCLAAMAVSEREMNTAEVAFAAIDAVDKLQFVLYVKEIPSVEGRNAELALWRRCPEEAEKILLQAGLVYRAIRMHIRLYNWERALGLAVSHKQHIDVVLAYRGRYLETCGREESIKAFKDWGAKVTVDWDEIGKKVAQEQEKEKNRPGAKAYGE